MPDINAEGQMLLVAVGWERQDWLHDCYPQDLPQWRAKGEGVWGDNESAATLLLWSVQALDFRQLRARADAAGERVRALVLDDPGADPGRAPELRAMLELMGTA